MSNAFGSSIREAYRMFHKPFVAASIEEYNQQMHFNNLEVSVAYGNLASFVKDSYEQTYTSFGARVHLLNLVDAICQVTDLSRYQLAEDLSPIDDPAKVTNQISLFMTFNSWDVVMSKIGQLCDYYDVELT